MTTTQVNKLLPSHVRAERGPLGHITVKSRITRKGEQPLAYNLDKSKFGNAREAAAYAESLIPK